MTSDLDHNPGSWESGSQLCQSVCDGNARRACSSLPGERCGPQQEVSHHSLLVTLRHQTSNGCIVLCLNVFPSAASFAFRCPPRVCRCCTDAEKHLRFAQTACALACGYSWERSGQTLQQKADFGLHHREKVAVIICWGAGTPRAVSAFTVKEKCVWRC